MRIQVTKLMRILADPDPQQYHSDRHGIYWVENEQEKD